MRSDHSLISDRSVDGQRMLFPQPAAWDALRNFPVIDEVPLGVEDLLWTLLETVNMYPELSLGLGRLGPAAKRWSPYVFVEMLDGLQRIHLECVTCNRCGWKGLIGNPTVVDIYLGVPGRDAALRRGWKQPVVACPHCHGELPRHAIWVEPVEAKSDAAGCSRKASDGRIQPSKG